jgi:hypothetical protein
MTYDEKFDEAISKLEAMNTHHPSMVWYSEAKFLYTLLPELIDFLKLGKQFQIDKLSHEEDIAAHWEYIQFVDKVLGVKDE